MKMHGIEAKDPVTMVFGKDEGPSLEEAEAAALGKEMPPRPEREDKDDGKRRKLFGIF